MSVYRDHRPDIRPFPGVVALLEALKPTYRLAILTDGYLRTQKLKLEALDLQRFFDTVVFTDELGRDAWKPNPVAFRVILERLGVLPEEAVYVGDNPLKDFIAARRAGMHSISTQRAEGVYGGHRPPHRSMLRTFP